MRRKVQSTAIFFPIPAPIKIYNQIPATNIPVFCTCKYLQPNSCYKYAGALYLLE